MRSADQVVANGWRRDGGLWWAVNTHAGHSGTLGDASPAPRARLDGQEPRTPSRNSAKAETSGRGVNPSGPIRRTAWGFALGCVIGAVVIVGLRLGRRVRDDPPGPVDNLHNCLVFVNHGIGDTGIWVEAGRQRTNLEAHGFEDFTMIDTELAGRRASRIDSAKDMKFGRWHVRSYLTMEGGVLYGLSTRTTKPTEDAELLDEIVDRFEIDGSDGIVP
jgi:hypothetical protein